MRKKLLLVLVVGIVLLFMMTLTACDLQSLLNGEVGNNEKGEIPLIVGLETIKASDDYLTSKEYLFNSQGNNPMALSFSEDYYLVIHYDNESKYSISAVTITWQDESTHSPSVTQKFNKGEFAEGSDTETTYIPFSTGENVGTGDIVFTVNSVLYVNGSSTTKMQWGEDVERNITVSVRPYFTLTLNYMDADKRRGYNTNPKVVETEHVYYKEDMKSYVTSPDFSGETAVPTKGGGWVFAGWYTQPLGQGEFVGTGSTYDYWCDMTLFAYYERMFNIETVELSQPITHTYLYRGSESSVEFTTGAVLTNRGLNKSDTVMSNRDLTITDTVFVEKYSVNTTTRADGMPSYTVNITGTEYPVVKLGEKVFTDFNTIIIASIGKYVEEIGYCAFQGCTKMEACSFAGGSRLKYIGDYAFENASELGKSSPFVLPSTVEYLGMCAFRYSGWGRTINADSPATGESRLRIPAHWKYIGYKCFANTRFERVIFEAGCHFEDQITNEEGKNDESNSGSRTIRRGVDGKIPNRIGAAIFSQCYPLWYVTFECDRNESNGLNIIPDYCFDAGSWWNKSDKRDGDFRCISQITFGEGLEEVGERAFNYQVKIPELCLPKSLKEIKRYAFYNCTSVTNLNFEHVERTVLDKEGVNKALTNDSRLETVRSYAFANLTGIDVVYITSEYFKLYGNGVFQGCTRLKCVIFNNIPDEDKIPTGFKTSNKKYGDYSVAKGDVIDDDEIYVGHEMSDLMFGAGEEGQNEAGKDDFAKTYSNPVRIFCNTEYTEVLKRDLLIGKELHAGGNSSGTKSFNSQVFVHPLDNLYEYRYVVDDEQYSVQVAVQEIYRASGGKPTTNVIGYSLVYWSARSEKIILPTQTDLNLSGGDIIELAAYAVPTSVTYLYIPSCYKRLEHDALNSCTSLSKVEFQDVNTLTYIGKYAFFGTAIRSFTGGSSLTVIGDYAFRGCESLVWVDLNDSPIVNAFNGRMTPYLYQYKYEYELDDYDEDYNNSLDSSCFENCTSLQWIRLPEKISQLRLATFKNCRALRVVIIPSKDISSSTSASDKTCFYETNLPRSVFDGVVTESISFYVHTDMTITHDTILPKQYVAGGTYNTLSNAPDHPSVD